MTATQQHALDLMPQLRDILGLSKDLDLPKLYRITAQMTHGEPGWTVHAQVWPSGDDLARWEALKAWGLSQPPVLSEPHERMHEPLGSWRQASVTVVVAEVSVEIWTHVDGGFEPPVPVLHRDEGDAAGWGYKEGVRKTSCGYEYPRDVADSEAAVTCPACKAAYAEPKLTEHQLSVRRRRELIANGEY